MNEVGELTPDALFAPDEREALRERWREIDGAFADDPKRAAGEADALVADLLQRIAQRYAYRRSTLELDWERSESVPPEGLEGAVQAYRTLFDRLLAD